MIKDKITPKLKERFKDAIKKTIHTGREQGFYICKDKEGKLFADKGCEGEQCDLMIGRPQDSCQGEINQGDFHTHPYTSIDTFEQMSSMGDSSLDLLLYGSSSANPNYPLFFLINKTDGTIDWAFKVSDPSIGDIIPPSASKYRFKTMSARSPTEVYIGATRSDKTYRGLFKFQDL